MAKEVHILLAGFGGQGTLFGGKLISYAGLIDGREVSWMPSYGPEMRGGTANCSVILSEEPIGSPLVTEPDVLIAMNQPSYDKFVTAVKPGGIVVADTSMIQEFAGREDIREFAIPATTIAEEAGLKGMGNVVMIGRLFAAEPFCDADTLDAALVKCVPPKKAALLDKNRQAIQLGMNA